MTWIHFALLSVIFSVTYSLLAKKLLNNDEDHDPIALASTLFGAVAIISLIAYLVSGFQISDLIAFTNSTTVLILIANLLLYVTAASLYWRALKHLPASEVSILYDLTTVQILLFGLSIGTETFKITRLIGGLLIVSAAIILGIQTQRKNAFKVNKYFWMLLVSTLFYALAALTDNIIITQKRFTPIFFQMLNFGIPALLLLVVNRKSIPHLNRLYQLNTYKYIVLNAIFFFASYWAIYKAYTIGGVTSEVNFVISTETILTVVLAAIILKERDHLKVKIVCAILATIGIYLLS